MQLNTSVTAVKFSCYDWVNLILLLYRKTNDATETLSSHK